MRVMAFKEYTTKDNTVWWYYFNFDHAKPAWVRLGAPDPVWVPTPKTQALLDAAT